MPTRSSALDGWSPEERARGRAWAAAWKHAGPALARVRRQELRNLDVFAAIAMLCGSADITWRRGPRNPPLV